MFPQFVFSEAEILAFSLVLLRVSAFIIAWPVFSVYSVPVPLKILLALVISVVVFPTIDRSGFVEQKITHELTWLVGKEVLTGLCLGYITRFFFLAVAAGGNLVATSLGLANAQVFNPSLSIQSTTVEQFYTALATLLFLALNGHHLFLSGLVQSFDAIPLLSVGTDLAQQDDRMVGNVINAMTGKNSGLVLQQVTEAGVKMSAPVMVVIFVLNVAMGIVGRAVPQINVLITSFPVNILTGLVVMLITIPALLMEMDQQLAMFAQWLFEFMKAS